MIDVLSGALESRWPCTSWDHGEVGDREEDQLGFLPPLVGDGRPLLLAFAGALVFSGGFMLFLAATGDFLPQDIAYLGMSADDLCGLASCRVVDFMIHDRAR